VKSPFLLYHKIARPAPDAKVRGAFTYPTRFEKQLRYLTRNGFRFMTASALIEHFRENGSFPEKTVSLTFDDGWKDNYINALPLLKKYDATATIFIVPSVLGKTTDQITAEGEGPREHMTVDDVREMSAAGIEFGSHTMRHKLLHEIPDEEALSEIRLSKTTIEDIVQKECRTFAYPAGFITDLAARCAADAGYRAAFSTVYGQDDGSDLFRLNRTEILRRDGYPFRFGRKIRSIFESNTA